MCVSVAEYVTYGKSGCGLKTHTALGCTLCCVSLSTTPLVPINRTPNTHYLLFCISDNTFLLQYIVHILEVCCFILPQNIWEEKQLIQACKEGDLETVKRLSFGVSVRNVGDKNWPYSSLLHHDLNWPFFSLLHHAAGLVMTC